MGSVWKKQDRDSREVLASIALLDNLDYRLDQTAPFNTTQTLKNVPVSHTSYRPGTPLAGRRLISPSGVQPDALHADSR